MPCGETMRTSPEKRKNEVASGTVGASPHKNAIWHSETVRAQLHLLWRDTARLREVE